MINLRYLDLSFFTDIVVSVTYFYDGYNWYGCINLGLVLVPSILVQVFSVRWFQMDSLMKKSYWCYHTLLMGVIQRYSTLTSKSDHLTKQK